jgi:hypothetical protein
MASFGIRHMDGVGVYKSWRWVFIIEGLPTVLLGVIVYFYLPNDPSSAKWLSEEEKMAMIERRTRDYACTGNEKDLRKEDVRSAFKDWKVWLFALGQFG